MCFQAKLYLAKEIQFFPGLGLYSAIFVIYLHGPSKESRTATIVFYVICLLYVLSTATLVCDLLGKTPRNLAVSINSISNLPEEYQSCSFGTPVNIKVVTSRYVPRRAPKYNKRLY